MLEDAARQAHEFKDEYVSSEHLLLALVAKDHGAATRALKDAGVRKDAFLKALADVRGTQRVTDQDAEGNTSRSASTPAISPAARAAASSIRSSAATRRSAAPSRCCRAAPRTTRC